MAARQYEDRGSLDTIDVGRDAVVLIAQEKEVLELKEGPNDFLRVPDFGKQPDVALLFKQRVPIAADENVPFLIERHVM